MELATGWLTSPLAQRETVTSIVQIRYRGDGKGDASRRSGAEAPAYPTPDIGGGTDLCAGIGPLRGIGQAIHIGQMPGAVKAIGGIENATYALAIGHAPVDDIVIIHGDEVAGAIAVQLGHLDPDLGAIQPSDPSVPLGSRAR